MSRTILTPKQKRLTVIYANTKFPAQGSALNDVIVAGVCCKQTFKSKNKLWNQK